MYSQNETGELNM